MVDIPDNARMFHSLDNFEKGSITMEDEGGVIYIRGKLKPRYRKKGKNITVIGVCR